MSETKQPQSDAILSPEEHVLSTLEQDGSRRWLKPRLSLGKWWKLRRNFGYFLIALFTVLPFLKIGGKQAFLLDIPGRQFTIFGYTFLPTDTVLLAIFMVALLLTIFLMTAFFGRVWCGWACPQTVYMEYVFRPIERFFDGTKGKGGPAKKKNPQWKIVLRYVVYLVVCFYLANTFLAYFVGVDELLVWARQSPFEHPRPFFIVAVVTFFMMFDFCVFREQTCILACPYGRFQSVLLDQESLIVSYDENRGEPRGKGKRKLPIVSDQPSLGDCIDCNQCVVVCPTGIDIRDGLQMECINCTQCIDACDAVMEKVKKPKGLIRYSSQSNNAGRISTFFRPRTIIYPVLLIGLVIAFVLVFNYRQGFNVKVLRAKGNPYSVEADGRIRNNLRLKVYNRTDKNLDIVVSVVSPKEMEIPSQQVKIHLDPGPTNFQEFPIAPIVPFKVFRRGNANFTIKLDNGKGVVREVSWVLKGPKKKPKEKSPAENKVKSDS